MEWFSPKPHEPAPEQSDPFVPIEGLTEPETRLVYGGEFGVVIKGLQALPKSTARDEVLDALRAHVDVAIDALEDRELAAEEGKRESERRRIITAIENLEQFQAAIDLLYTNDDS